MSPDKSARRRLFGSAICGISFCLLGLPLKAAETCCVEISPRLKYAFISFETAGEIYTSFETRNGRLVIGFSECGLPSSGTILYRNLRLPVFSAIRRAYGSFQ